MKKLLALPFLLLAALAFCQDEGLQYTNHVYLDNIRSVNFHQEGLLLSPPLLDLSSGWSLKLSFDDLDGDAKDYLYTVVHCNADWTPSRLLENEYISGFQEERITEFEYSFKTKSIYTHYLLYFPNRDVNITKSGNYLLKVYENEDEKRLAITRRFVVYEPLVKIFPDVVRPAIVSKGDTHQEVDFRVTHQGFDIRSPRQELSATILQNGRWDNAVTGVLPLFSRTEEQIFDYQDKVVFQAGKEFRDLDLRSIKYGSRDIERIEQNGEFFEANLATDEKRGHSSYLEFEDINGGFIIENIDDGARRYINIDDAGRDDFLDKVHDLEGTYGRLLFSLKSPTVLDDQDIYVFGGLTDWELKPDFKMVYNPAIYSYVAKPMLKQGYYNYIYVTVPKGKNAPIDHEETEGNWYETKNTYTILIYYRPFGERFDRIIGARTFTSRL